MKQIVIIILFIANALSLQAREVYPLNEGWKFYFRYENSSDNARLVSLPHTWNNDAIGTTGPYLQTIANYLNDFFMPIEWRDKRIFVKFYGVQNVANIFVNGKYLGEHRGGSTAFTLELTDKLVFGRNNSIIVEVSNVYENDVLPTSTDMNIFGGIYRNVELIVADKLTISPLYYGSSGVLIHPKSVTPQSVAAEAEIHIDSKVGNNCQLNLDILNKNGEIVTSLNQKVKLGKNPVRLPFTITNPNLWSPKKPALYSIRVQIQDGNYSDEITIKTGFRNIDAKLSNGGLNINGESIKVNGITYFHDNIVRGAAITNRDYDRDLDIIKSVGVNAIHSAVMPHAQYLYDRCDEEGLLAWVDIPFYRAPFFSDRSYFPTARFEDNGVQQLREIVAQNINHPSVVMWGIFSLQLVTGDLVIPYIDQLNKLAHSLDPSRPTVALSNQDGEMNFITDLIVWEQDLGWSRGSTGDLMLWSSILRNKWSHLKSAVSFGKPGFGNHRTLDNKTNININWFPEHRQTTFHEEYMKNIGVDSLFWGVWVNNIFDFSSSRRSYGINANGLVSYDRQEYKDAFYLYKSLWNKEEHTLHIVDKRNKLRTDTIQRFKVYSSVGMPILLVNSDTVAMHEYAPAQYLSDSVTVKGIIEVKAIAADLSDEVKLRVGNVLKQKRSLVPLQKVGPISIN